MKKKKIKAKLLKTKDKLNETRAQLKLVTDELEAAQKQLAKPEAESTSAHSLDGTTHASSDVVQ